jgi:hypothetical protein
MVLMSAVFVLSNLSACAQPPGNLEDLATHKMPQAALATPNSSDDIAGCYGFQEMEIIKLDWQISNLQINDFNGDGRNDIAVANNRKARIELLIQREAVHLSQTPQALDPNEVDVNEITAPTRFDRHSIGVTQKIASLVSGDFNSDGRPDLAFYGEPPKGLYVMLQKADGSTAKAPAWSTPKRIEIDDALPVARALACGDINGDGRDDLVLAGRDTLYVIRQQDDGSLAEPVKYPTMSQTLAVHIGDLNGDGRADLILITADSDRPVHVRFGLKTGQLGPVLQLAAEKPIPHTVMLSDYDNNGKDEILFVESQSDRLGSSSLGGQKAAANGDWLTLFYPLPAGKENARRDLAVGDFDADRWPDVVISDPEAAELVFYRQQAQLGLTEPARFPAFAGITSLSAGDLDGDGQDELAVLSVKEKVLGISRFNEDRLEFPQPLNLPGEPVAMDLADVDADGKLDCVYVFKDPNDIRWLAVAYNAELRENRAQQPSRKLELTKLLSNPQGLKVLDADQDGLADCLIFVSYEQPIFARQVRKGQFELIDSAKTQGSLVKDASAGSVAVADIDGRPGSELLVAQKNFARSLVFSNAQQWKVIDQYNARSTEDNIGAVGALDVDADGVMEILLLEGQKGWLQILAAGPNQTYQFKQQVQVGKWNIRKMLFAALTGKPKDKSVLLFDGDKFAVLSSPAVVGPVLGLEQRFSYETEIKEGKYGQLTAGDINSDGRSEFIMVEYKRNHIEILALDENFAPRPAMRFRVFEEKSYREGPGSEPSVEPRELAVADVTGDGKPDLVVVIHDRIIIYPQD